MHASVVAMVMVMVMMVRLCDGEVRQHKEAEEESEDEQRREQVQGMVVEASGPTPVRHEDEENIGGVAVGGEEPKDGECPPPRPFTTSLCSAPACLHHHGCQEGRACCFNGCIHTCLPSVDAPPVIDWLVDTGSLLPILGEGPPPELPVRYEDLSYAEGREEAVHLPGGCTISGTQYTQLQALMEAPSIQSCMCELGEVVCAVKMQQS